MIRYTDRALAVLLFLGAVVGHTYGSFKLYGHNPLMLFWALHASVLGGLLASSTSCEASVGRTGSLPGSLSPARRSGQCPPCSLGS